MFLSIFFKGDCNSVYAIFSLLSARCIKSVFIYNVELFRNNNMFLAFFFYESFNPLNHTPLNNFNLFILSYSLRNHDAPKKFLFFRTFYLGDFLLSQFQEYWKKKSGEFKTLPGSLIILGYRV